MAGSETQTTLQTATAVSSPGTPATPGTPGPLLTSLHVDSVSYERCVCLPRKGHTCFTDFSVPTPHVSFSRKLGAEFVGTFFLMFVASAGPIVNQIYNGAEGLLGNAACSGLGVMMVILSTGHISGAHLNPSVSIAFATFRHFPWVQVPAYIAAQVAATLCASFSLKAIFHPFKSGGVTVPSESMTVVQAFALEFVITFIMLFVVFAVATDTRAVGELAGIAVGGTVLLNSLVAGPATGASMNPVRTLGPAVAAGNYRHIWIYFVAPTLGALSGAGVYTLVKLREHEVELPRQIRSFRR